MTKLRKSAVIAIAGLALLLSGCEIETVMKFNADETVDPSIIISMSKEETTMLSSMGDGEKVTCDTFMDTMGQDMMDDEVVETKTLDAADGGLKCEIKYETMDAKELGEDATFKKEGDLYLLDIPSKDFEKMMDSSGDAEDMGAMMDYKFTFIMPGTIKSAAVDSKPVKANGNTLTLTSQQLAGDIEIASKEGGGSALPLILGIVGLVVVVGVVVVIILVVVNSKKKKSGPTANNQFMMQPGQTGQPGQPGQPFQPGQPGQQPFAQPFQPGQPGQAGMPAPGTATPQMPTPGMTTPGMATPPAQPEQMGQPGQPEMPPIQPNPTEPPQQPGQPQN